MRQCGRGGTQLQVADVAIQRVVLSHGRDQRPCQIDAHFPAHPAGAPCGRGQVGEGLECTAGELTRPGVEAGLLCGPRDLVEGMHPLGQVVEVLAVAVPLQALVEGLAGTPLRQAFTDAQPAPGWMPFTLVFTQSADPPRAPVIVPMPAQGVMNLVDQLQCAFRVALLAAAARQAEIVADREGVRPQVAPPGSFRCKPGTLREVIHQRDGFIDTWIGHASSLLLHARLCRCER